MRRPDPRRLPRLKGDVRHRAASSMLRVRHIIAKHMVEDIGVKCQDVSSLPRAPRGVHHTVVEGGVIHQDVSSLPRVPQVIVGHMVVEGGAIRRNATGAPREPRTIVIDMVVEGDARHPHATRLHSMQRIVNGTVVEGGARLPNAPEALREARTIVYDMAAEGDVKRPAATNQPREPRDCASRTVVVSGAPCASYSVSIIRDSGATRVVRERAGSSSSKSWSRRIWISTLCCPCTPTTIRPSLVLQTIDVQTSPTSSPTASSSWRWTRMPTATMQGGVKRLASPS